LPSPPQPEIGGDHGLIRPGDRVLLIVERDPTFANILLQTAHEQGLKALIVPRGEPALALAREIQPAAITLDLGLPDLHGWKALQRLKDDPRTCHIPVHIISGEESGLRGLERGAVACLKKPVSKRALDEAFANMKSLADSPPKHLLDSEDGGGWWRRLSVSARSPLRLTR
jgi:DNA-binding response OmpR family regulator